MTEREALTALQGDDVAEAAQAANLLWQMWHRSGNARLDALLREGIEAMERQDLPAADAAGAASRRLPQGSGCPSRS